MMRHVRHVFAWLGGITFIVICAVVIAGFVVRARMVPRLERDLFVTQSPSTDTPRTFGVPYHAINIDSQGRSLRAWTVDAGAGTPALLLFHGNGQTLHDFAKVQAYLFHRHVSSMSFDYSGFGESSGKPTLQHLNQDARAAWEAFARWAGSAHPGFVLGYSLGTAVVLHNVHAFVPKPVGIVVYGAFSSARQLIEYISPRMPIWLIAIMPDLWDNVEAAQTLREPLLVIAGMNDTNVLPSMGRRIALFAEAANRHSAFVLVPDVGHGGIVDHMDSVWPPILAFVHQLTAPGPEQGKQPSTPAPANQHHAAAPATGNRLADSLRRIVSTARRGPLRAMSGN